MRSCKKYLLLLGLLLMAAVGGCGRESGMKKRIENKPVTKLKDRKACLTNYLKY